MWKHSYILYVTTGGLSISCCQSNNANQMAVVQRTDPAQQRGEDELLGVAGLGDHRCALTYQLVKVVKGMSSAANFYEPESADLVSRESTLRTDFGVSCVTYCSTQFQALRTQHGNERVLFKNCQFQRDIPSAWVKGLVESYSNGTLSGWACKYGQEASVNVDIYAGGPAGTGALLGRATANLVPSIGTDQSAIGKECGTRAAKHRFSFLVPEALRTQHVGKSLFVHAIDTANKGRNFAIGNSGALSLPPVSLPTVNVNPKAFNAFNIWSDGQGSEILDYPQGYDVNTGSTTPDGVFYDNGAAYQKFFKFIGVPTEGAKVVNEVLEYPVKNGKQLKLKFTKISVTQMSHRDAVTYCKNQGLRLPTVRELFDFCAAGVTGPNYLGERYPPAARCGKTNASLVSASVSSNVRSLAWRFFGLSGVVSLDARDFPNGVRCVGGE